MTRGARFAAAIITLLGCSPPSSGRQVDQKGDADATAAPLSPTRSLVGPVSDSLTALISRSPSPIEAITLIVLNEENCFTCEDLGRQLREVLHSYDSGRRRAVVAISGGGADRIAQWLRRERVAPIQLVVSPTAPTMHDGTFIPTPAILLLNMRGEKDRGIAHLMRVPNIRIRSFARELDLNNSR